MKEATITLPYLIERVITIEADRATVFRYFTDSVRWAKWWGEGSTIDARPGGAMLIRYPGGTEARGEVIEVAAPERIVFTYGYATGTPIAPGGSRVTIRLEKAGDGTRLLFSHELADEAVRNEHVQGWRYQLSVFTNVVLDEVHAGAGETVDQWFAAWAEPDTARRRAAFERIASPRIQFRDRFSIIDGLDDLVAHSGAAQRFMPGIRMERFSGIRHCQGTVLAEWKWVTPTGDERGRGTNVFALDPDGRIRAVTGLMAANDAR